MKIAITGASGFIGGGIVAKLAKKYSVVTVVRPSSDIAQLGGTEIRYADITSKKQVLSALVGVDVVVHCAALLPHHNASSERYASVNVTGTRNLLSAAVQCKVKQFIHISTVGIYDIEKNPFPSESTRPKPTDIYSQTKLAAERLVMSYGRKNLHTTIFRPTLAFGPGDTRPGFYNLFKLIKRGIFVPLAKDNVDFHTLYVGNLVDVVAKSILNKSAFDEDFIIGDVPCPKLSDFIEAIYRVNGKTPPTIHLPLFMAKVLAVFGEYVLEKIGLPAPLTTRRLKFISQAKQYDTTKAVRILGYKPHYTLAKAVSLTSKWYEKNNLI